MKALIVVDAQKDFCEGGSLAVAGGNQCAKDIASYLSKYGEDYNMIIFSRDWHNPWPDTNGGHFSENPDFEDSWPVHCVSGSFGAEYHRDIDGWMEYAKSFLPDLKIYEIKKGQGKPHYSAAQGVTDDGKTLSELLKGIGIVDICGIAFDKCVMSTAIDLYGYGDIHVLTNLTAGISRLSEMQAAILLNSYDVYLDEVEC